VLKFVLLLSSLSAAYAESIQTRCEWVTRAPGFGNALCSRSRLTGVAAWVRIRVKCQSMLRLLGWRTASGPRRPYSYQIRMTQLTVAAGISPGAGLRRARRDSRGQFGCGSGQFRARVVMLIPYWGLSFAVPGAWKANEREVTVTLGSDTEAGLIIVRFVRSTNNK